MHPAAHAALVVKHADGPQARRVRILSLYRDHCDPSPRSRPRHEHSYDESEEGQSTTYRGLAWRVACPPRAAGLAKGVTQLRASRNGSPLVQGGGARARVHPLRLEGRDLLSPLRCARGVEPAASAPRWWRAAGRRGGRRPRTADPPLTPLARNPPPPTRDARGAALVGWPRTHARAPAVRVTAMGVSSPLPPPAGRRRRRAGHSAASPPPPHHAHRRAPSVARRLLRTEIGRTLRPRGCERALGSALTHANPPRRRRRRRSARAPAGSGTICSRRVAA